MRTLLLVSAVCIALMAGERPACAQGQDRPFTGMVIGAAIGAGAGIAFTHAVRDSDLGFTQYARGALIFGALGAGIGLGLDVLLARDHGVVDRGHSVTFAPAANGGRGVVLRWRW